MKGIMDYRIAREEHVDLPDEFIRKVLQFPKVGIHAQRNAEYSAQLVENDRRLTRMAEIQELLATYEAQRDSLNMAIFTLQNEYEMQRTAKP
jgi:hypothetical protein